MKYNAYKEGYDIHIVQNHDRNRILAELVREGHRRGYYVLLLLKRLQHLKLVSESLPDTPHKIVAGTDYRGETFIQKQGKMVRKVLGEKIKVRERQRITRNFEAGDVRVILANDVFKKGISIKRLDVVIDAAAQKSKDDAAQKFGRGVRLHPNKKGLIYIDLADQDAGNKRNWFAKAAKSRKRAFTQLGLTIRDFDWNGTEQARELYDRAEKLLQKELKQLPRNSSLEEQGNDT